MSIGTRVFRGRKYHLVRRVMRTPGQRSGIYDNLAEASLRRLYSAPYRVRRIPYKWVKTNDAWLLYARRGN